MIHQASRARGTVPRTTLDLSRKTSLVSRFWYRGVGRHLRRLAVAAALLLREVGGHLMALAALARLSMADALGGAWVGVVELVGLMLLGALLARALVSRLRRIDVGPQADGEDAAAADLELAVLAVTATWSAIVLTGGLVSPWKPALYLVVALLVAFHPPRIASAAVGFALGAELLLAWRHGWLASQPEVLVADGLFVAGFAALYHLALSAIVRRARSKANAAVEAHVSELHQRAREYRLIVSGSGAPLADADGHEKWITAAVGEVEAAVRAAVEVAQLALGTRTVAVYLLSPDGNTLRLRECLSDSVRISREPLAAGEGLPGVVLRRERPVRLCGDFRGAVYDKSGERPRAFLGVPLLDRTTGDDEAFVRGVVLADRSEAEAFTDRDEQLLGAVAGEIMRAMQGERVLGYIRKEKDEKARFFRAIEALNLLSKPGEICQQVALLATELAPLDFVAVTLVESEGGAEAPPHHRVVEALGPGAEALRQRTFEDNAGLVSNVVRLGSPLPGREFHQMDRTLVFGDGLPMPSLSTLKVVPMSAGETVVGTVVCGAAARGALSSDAVRMLGVLAIQAAGAITRARLFEKTERMATTDGLTGLNNHRRFRELFDQALAGARRYARPVSVLLADVDHFKSVNDTYGHPAGDKVLRGVAALIAAEARDTDVCARYGGEEFAVVLPETDLEGARVIADRIRRAVEGHVFHTDLGPLSVTLSAGVASCPEHGDDQQVLIDRCDQALYAAKRSGRNRVVAAH